MPKPLTVLVLLLLCISSYGNNIIIVTSNADAGPGTLREAITIANANGTTTVDSIVFDIADQSVGGRTIILTSELPLLTSNMIIDGSSQAGFAIGVTDSKIRITCATGVSIHQAFGILDAHDIRIYGIHFYALIRGDFSTGTAIGLRNASNILIGAPGKGNYFTGVLVALGDLYQPYPGRGFSLNVSFKSNIVNLTEDGGGIYNYSPTMSLTNVKNLEIGGDADNEGNFIVGGYGYSMDLVSDTFANVNFGYTKLLNNKFGCDHTQTQRLYAGTVYITANTGYGYTDTTDVTIRGNSYDFLPTGSSIEGQQFIIIRDKKGFIDIKGNKIDMLSPPNSYYFSNLVNAFEVVRCENGIIGGDNVNDTNFIAGCWSNGIGLGDNKNITISKNSMWCNGQGILAHSSFVTIPKTKIFTLTDFFVSGTSSVPNCTIEVFLNKAVCIDCKNGKTYLGSVTSDASGNWSFTSPVLLDGPVTATATTPTGATGEFAHPEYEQVDYREKYPTCGLNNGYIHGMKFVAGTRYYWVRSYATGTDTLFTEDIDNAAPGFYKFVVEQGPYCSVSYQVSLLDMSPKINASNMSIVQPSCGQNNGKIQSFYVSGSYNKLYWKDSFGNVVGASTDLINVGPGQYKLVALDTINGCGDSTQFYTLINQAGPSLDLSSAAITAAVCNQNGKITGITALNVNGSPVIKWVDSLNRVVGTNYDLLNVPPGKYRMKFKDGGNCDTITSTYFVVRDTGSIAIDTSGKIVTASKCSGPSGSIQQIKVTGADQYQWIDVTTNNVVANAVNAFNLPANSYQLIASNSLGCSARTASIVVPQSTFVDVRVAYSQKKNENCAQHNGNITITSFTNDPKLYSFTWVDSSSQQTVGAGTQANNLAAGTYQLFAKDTNQCAGMIFTEHLVNIPPPVINSTNVRISNDHCNNLEGSITSLQVSGLTGNTTYAWYDVNNQVVGNSINLQNVGAGKYYLKILDAGVCSIQSDTLAVTNINDMLPPPSYADLIIPRNSDAVLKVNAAGVGAYILSSGGNVLQQNATGEFIVKAISTDTVFYVQRTYGSCSSAIVRVNVKVVDKSFFAIPNAFTPNADGHNDRLHVRVIGYIKLSYFRIYNRWGQLVFETKQLNDGWDGRVNGLPQDQGAYVWIAQGTDVNGIVVKDKGSFVLVR